MLFYSLHNQIEKLISGASSKQCIRYFDKAQLIGAVSYLVKSKTINLNNRTIFFLTNENTIDEDSDAFEQCGEDVSVIRFRGMPHIPYQGFIPSAGEFKDYFDTLLSIARPFNGVKIIVTSLLSLTHKTAPLSFWQQKIVLKAGDVIEPSELVKSLVNFGLKKSYILDGPGSFSTRGDVFDVHPLGAKPFRIQFFEELIEKINPVEELTNRTINSVSLESVEIGPGIDIISNTEYRQNYSTRIKVSEYNFIERLQERKRITESLQEGRVPPDSLLYFPLFHKLSETILQWPQLQDAFIINSISINLEHEIARWNEQIKQEYSYYLNNRQDARSLSRPEDLYDFEIYNNSLSSLPVLDLFSRGVEDNSPGESVQTVTEFLSSHHLIEKYQHKANALLLGLKEVMKDSGKVFIFTKNPQLVTNIKSHWSTDELNSLEFVDIDIGHGLYFPDQEILILGNDDFNAKRLRRTKRKEISTDFFAEQIATLKSGDFVVYSACGVGKYLGLQNLKDDQNNTDFLVIEYQHGDKVYVPIYKIDQVQKYAEKDTDLSISNLRTNKFSLLKEKIRTSIKKLAFDLIKLQATRKIKKAFSFGPPDQLYRDFEVSFPFQETPDQADAIDRVLNNMQSDFPMDHLVCGDVGFGKTEVALRAAFKAVEDKKQVAVLVPTTILAFQHYNSFKKRMTPFAINVEFISRFKSPKERDEIFERVNQGKVDILIGTHSILNDKLKFYDLGLVIVDEEQKFGVAHKEKLKLLRTNIDFLTLTATPIPRTLQLSFMGLKELSIIKTAPPNRQSVNTFLIFDDDLTIQEAIQREINRGGQVFFVHNKVNDIEFVYQRIKHLVPEAKIVIGHGQLRETELEKVMVDFYEGKYNVLLCTTIIESGIDIPSANTLLINNAQEFGLSQLHQLRGRIGRSDQKAYAYFIIPNRRILSEIADERLKAIQTYSELGAGFSIANRDLELRGAGNILGGEQSGHIAEIGIELYMQLLDDAILELKGEDVLDKNIEISFPFAAYIPTNFIEDPSERIKTYKRLSSARKIEDLEQIQSELSDIYGKIPEELKNYLTTIHMRLIAAKIHLSRLQILQNSMVLTFHQSFLVKHPDSSQRMIQMAVSKKKKYKLIPDYKLQVDLAAGGSPDLFLQEMKDIAQQLNIV